MWLRYLYSGVKESSSSTRLSIYVLVIGRPSKSCHLATLQKGYQCEGRLFFKEFSYYRSQFTNIFLDKSRKITFYNLGVDSLSKGKFLTIPKVIWKQRVVSCICWVWSETLGFIYTVNVKRRIIVFFITIVVWETFSDRHNYVHFTIKSGIEVWRDLIFVIKTFQIVHHCLGVQVKVVY